MNNIMKLTREEFEAVAAMKPASARALAALRILEERFTQKPAGRPVTGRAKTKAQRDREYRERLKAKQ